MESLREKRRPSLNSETDTEHWSRLTKNPIGDAALEFVRMQLDRAYLGRLSSYEETISKYIAGKTVLDIGLVEHTRELIDREGWKHRKFRNAAKRIVGCDVLPEEVEYLQQLGYDVRLVDGTSDADIGERFETVFVGDVIEHVGDPVRLLSFGARHLDREGSIVVTTPCPFWYKNLWAALRQPPFIGNVDHVCWVTPFNAIELAHRASLKLEGYWLVQNQGHNAVTRWLHRIRASTGFGNSEVFSWAYVYVYRRD